MTSLSCRIVRSWAALREDIPTTGWVARHVENCSECARVFSLTAGLERQLRAEAILHRQTPSAALAQRIQREIQRAGQPAPRRSYGPQIAWAGVLAACVIVAGLAFVWLKPPTSSVLPDGIAIVRPLPNSAPTARVTPTWSALAEPVKSLLAEDPLETEVSLVYADARSAVRFLALNFLPTHPADLPATEGRGETRG